MKVVLTSSQISNFFPIPFSKASRFEDIGAAWPESIIWRHLVDFEGVRSVSIGLAATLRYNVTKSQLEKCHERYVPPFSFFHPSCLHPDFLEPSFTVSASLAVARRLVSHPQANSCW